MSASYGRLAQFLLRFGPLFAGLRRVPLLGKCLSWAGAKLVPRDSLAWVQVQNGPARGLGLHLNPRTGSTYFEGGGELEVQEALLQHLGRGLTFYDAVANMGFFLCWRRGLLGKMAGWWPLAVTERRLRSQKLVLYSVTRSASEDWEKYCSKYFPMRGITPRMQQAAGAHRRNIFRGRQSRSAMQRCGAPRTNESANKCDQGAEG